MIKINPWLSFHFFINKYTYTYVYVYEIDMNQQIWFNLYEHPNAPPAGIWRVYVYATRIAMMHVLL